MKIKVGDKNFKLSLVTRDKFNELVEDGHDAEAITDVNDSTIIFANDSRDFPLLVRHEIFHAYFSLNLVSSSSLTMDQTEELCAEIVGKYGEEIVNTSKKVHTWIKKRLKKL